jgi:phage shock protein E
MLRSSLVLALLLTASPIAAQSFVPTPNRQIDYAGFRKLADEVEPYRQTRLLGWSSWLAAAAEADVLILDARSERQFAMGHIAGAVNVPLPEFSVERLAEVIGRSDRPILIYCNNNFRNNRPPAILKSAPVALNIPTFIHLVAYGYRNVRELNDVLDFENPAVPWVTSEAPTPARPG